MDLCRSTSHMHGDAQTASPMSLSGQKLNCVQPRTTPVRRSLRTQGYLSLYSLSLFSLTYIIFTFTLARSGCLHRNMENCLESEKPLNTQPTQCRSIFSCGLFANQNRHMVDFLEFKTDSAAKGEDPQTRKAFDTLSVQEKVKSIQNDRNHVQMM
jgi:hypothetical protein